MSIKLVDCTLRDGANAIGQRFSPEQVRAVAAALDAAGVQALEVGHGDGLAASSIQFGRTAHAELDLIAAASSAVERSRIAVSIQPGVATQDDMRAARERGATIFKVATHATEADIGVQHLRLGRELGGETSGGLMMSHTVTPDVLVEQARIMVDAGATVVYVADSAGALTMDGIRARVAAVRNGIPADVAVGIHCHDNLGLGVANTLVAVQEGATVVDACLAGLGAGAGNCHLEAIVACLERAGFDPPADLKQLQDASEEFVRPLVPPTMRIDRDTLTLGYAGVYSSFLLHAKHAAEQYGVDVRDILIELGRQHIIGAQEDQILAVAATLNAQYQLAG